MNKFNEIIQGSTPILVDFYADWCSPCKMMPSILKEVKDDLGDQIRILKINVDSNQQLAAQYNIRSIPTLMLLQNGQVKWSGAGVHQAAQIKQIIKSNSN